MNTAASDGCTYTLPRGSFHRYSVLKAHPEALRGFIGCTLYLLLKVEDWPPAGALTDSWRP